jgi:hypothetical protein
LKFKASVIHSPNTSHIHAHANNNSVMSFRVASPDCWIGPVTEPERSGVEAQERDKTEDSPRSYAGGGGRRGGSWAKPTRKGEERSLGSEADPDSNGARMQEPSPGASESSSSGTRERSMGAASALHCTPRSLCGTLTARQRMAGRVILFMA